MKGATLRQIHRHNQHTVSIHAPNEGSDLQVLLVCSAFDFPVSIHAPNEGSDASGVEHETYPAQVSIHAPNEGSDPHLGRVGEGLWVSIHAPNEGSDRLPAFIHALY